MSQLKWGFVIYKNNVIWYILFHVIPICEST